MRDESGGYQAQSAWPARVPRACGASHAVRDWVFSGAVFEAVASVEARPGWWGGEVHALTADSLTPFPRANFHLGEDTGRSRTVCSHMTFPHHGGQGCTTASVTFAYPRLVTRGRAAWQGWLELLKQCVGEERGISLEKGNPSLISASLARCHHGWSPPAQWETVLDAD